MNTSDIFAITAVIASGIVSIIAILIGYLNNKANINARRSEAAFQARLEAFSRFTKKIGEIRILLTGGSFKEKEDDIKEFLGFMREISKGYDELVMIFEEQRIFFPPPVAKEINKMNKDFASLMARLQDAGDPKILDKLIEFLLERENKVVSLMQRFVKLHKHL